MSIEQVVDAAASHGPSELERINYLDGWRGLAILLVLQGHFFTIPGLHSGRMGVDVFFCLSGLLMSKILFVRRVPLRTFYKRRITRIIPSFLLYVAVIYCAAAMFGNAAPWPEVASTALFLRAYFPADVHMFANGYPIGHLWSLNVEEHCYIFLSTLTLFFFLRGREGWALILAGAASIAIHLLYMLVPETAPPADFWIRTEAASANLLLSAGYALLKDKLVPWVRPWMPVAAFALGSVFYVGVIFNWMIPMTVSPFLFAFAVNHLAEAPKSVRTALNLGPLRLLGICSFSLYLWQQPFYQYKDSWLTDMTGQALLIFSMAMAVGFAMFYSFENPSRSYLNRVW
jgi:peptidoglycan/LPS O-acetylase OafA/YrhL